MQRAGVDHPLNRDRPGDTPVWAVADGTVRFTGRNGIQVRLRHRSGNETNYNHLPRIATDVRPGEPVRGQDRGRFLERAALLLAHLRSEAAAAN